MVVDLHRVVDDQVERQARFHQACGKAEPYGRPAHRCQVGQHRNTGEILQQDACDAEGDLAFACRLGLPAGELADVVLGDLDAIAATHQGFENDAQRGRQA